MINLEPLKTSENPIILPQPTPAINLHPIQFPSSMLPIQVNLFSHMINHLPSCKLHAKCDHPFLQRMMSFHPKQLIISTILLILCNLSLGQNTNSSSCVQVCGNKHVPYPFGFSDGCGIKLNCNKNNGSIKVGGFIVQNLTSYHIVVQFPPNCNLMIEKLSTLFGHNYAPTSRNALLFKNCSSRDCVLPNSFFGSRFPKTCGFGPGNGDRRNISCYLDTKGNETTFLDLESVRKSNCSFLFSSVIVDSCASASVWLDVRTVELVWWINGKCDCDPNAICRSNVSRIGPWFHCKCREGFTGDGFTNGTGCQRVSAGRGDGTRVGVLVGGVLAGVSLVAVLAVTFYCVKKRSKSLKTRLSAKNLLSKATGNSNIPFYTYKEIERATNGFSDKQRLGTGAYGTVYSGKLQNNELVAIKKIRHRDHDSIEKVLNEIKLLSAASHTNLVRLLGCCIDNGEQILVFEYMPNGTLSQHLQREGECTLPWTLRLSIAAETARAIAHLHSGMNHPPIYHRDIKSSNILLDYNFNSKVADFGLSRFGMMDDSHISTAPQGTPGYVDPQYHQNFHLSDKSDVYSFGVVLVEIITAMKVVDFSRPQNEINLAALAMDRIGKGRVDEIIDPFIEPNRDAWTLTSVHKVSELAFRCLAFHRDMRPSMMEVADELEQIRLSGWAPLDDNIGVESTAGSYCSSPYCGSEKSSNASVSKKLGVGSRRLIAPHKDGDGLPAMEEEKYRSPVSVQDPWLSEQSSPPSNSLLGTVAH